MKYKDFKPSEYDRHIKVEGREDWEVIPFASRNRDSQPLQSSNFEFTEAALNGVEEEGQNWEIMRFGHWACGWFEIMVFNPECQAIKEKVEEIDQNYRDHVVLDEDRYMELLHELEESEEME